MNLYSRLGWIAPLLLSTAAFGAELAHHGQCCSCEGPKTLLRWPGQEDEEQEEEEEAPLATDRPDFTEASSTVGRGHVQLEFGYTYFQDDEDGTRVRGHSLPETLLRVGMLAEMHPGLDIQAISQMLVRAELGGGLDIALAVAPEGKGRKARAPLNGKR